MHTSLPSRLTWTLCAAPPAKHIMPEAMLRQLTVIKVVSCQRLVASFGHQPRLTADPENLQVMRLQRTAAETWA